MVLNIQQSNPQFPRVQWDNDSADLPDRVQEWHNIQAELEQSFAMYNVRFLSANALDAMLLDKVTFGPIKLGPSQSMAVGWTDLFPVVTAPILSPKPDAVLIEAAQDAGAIAIPFKAGKATWFAVGMHAAGKSIASHEAIAQISDRLGLMAQADIHLAYQAIERLGTNMEQLGCAVLAWSKPDMIYSSKSFNSLSARFAALNVGHVSGVFGEGNISSSTVLAMTATEQVIAIPLRLPQFGAPFLQVDDIVLLKAERRQSKPMSRLAEQYNLSPAEMRTVMQLSQGLLISEIANELGLSEGTVRQQLKSTYRKIGVSSQHQVLARLLALSGQ